MAQLVVKSECCQKDMCCDEIGLCASTILIYQTCVVLESKVYSNKCQVVKTTLTYMAYELNVTLNQTYTLPTPAGAGHH